MSLNSVKKKWLCHLDATYYVRLVALFVIASLSFLPSACVIEPAPSAFDSKTQWLANSYPDHAKNIEKINADPRFRQDILTGIVSKGMSMDEVLVAREIKPYGPHPSEKVYWCQDQRVNACSPQCGDCRAMLVLKHHIHFFETGSRGLQLVASYPNNKWQPRLSYLPSSYTAARHILRNEYARGMQLDDIAQVATPPASKTQYFCGGENHGRRDIPCPSNCIKCRVEIHIPRDGKKPPRIIDLHFSHGVVDNLSQRPLQ